MNTLYKLLIIILIGGRCHALSFEDYEKCYALNKKAYDLQQESKFQDALVLINDSIKLDFDVIRNSSAYLYKTSCLTALGDFSEAIDVNKYVISQYSDKKDPRLWSWYRGSAFLSSRLKNYDAAESYFAVAYSIHTDSELKNSYAWLIATAPQLTHRDSVLGLKLAKEACEETQYNVTHILDTLAAAYADTGDFNKAIEMQGKAIKIVGENKIMDYTIRVKLYEKKIKYRQDIDVEKAIKLLSGDDKF